MPPDAFITWPTNQPIAFGFVLASATLSGFLGDDVIDKLFERPNVGHLLQAAMLDDHARIAALGPDYFEYVLGNLAGDRAVANQIKNGADLRRRDRGRGNAAALAIKPAQ